MHKYQKYINALFIVAAALVWFLAKHYIGSLFGYFQLGRRFNSEGALLLVNHGLPLIFGVLTFAILRGNTKSYEFVSDSIGEVVKVIWPTQKDVKVGTIVVIIAVLISAIVLGLLDMGFTTIIKTVISN